MVFCIPWGGVCVFASAIKFFAADKKLFFVDKLSARLYYMNIIKILWGAQNAPCNNGDNNDKSTQRHTHFGN